MATPLGNDDQMVIVEASHGVGGSFAGSLEVALVDPKGTKAVPDGARVTTENVIEVAMEDLLEKDQEEVESELEEEMVERRRKKLACFQKTRSGVVKKGDTAKASIPVSSPFTLEELVHMIDVSVNSKYIADFEGKVIMSNKHPIIMSNKHKSMSYMIQIS
jgi:hypothetical protein